MLSLASQFFLGAVLCLLRTDDVVVVAFSIFDNKYRPLSSSYFDLTPAIKTEFHPSVSGQQRHRPIWNSRNTHSLLFASSSKRQKAIGDSQYHNNDDDILDNDDVVVVQQQQDPSPPQRENNKSKWKQVSRTRERIQAEDTIDDDYYEDDEDEDDFVEEVDVENDYDQVMVEEKKDPRYMPNNSRRRRQLDEYDDRDWDEQEYYDDDQFDEDETDAGTGGNFWSNPIGGMDRGAPSRGFLRRDLNRPRLVNVPRRPRPQREYDGRPDYYVNDSRRTPRKGPAWRSPVRVGAPPPNPIIERLYDRIFFYGFDMDDQSSGVGDKTVFGGTKGKFNGLKYLALSMGDNPTSYMRNNNRSGPNAQTARGLPPARDGESDKDYYQDDYQDDNQPEDSYPSESVRNRFQRRMERGRNVSGRSRGASYYDEEDFGFTSGWDGRDWVSEQVSTWFTEDDVDDSYVVDDAKDRYNDQSVPMDRQTQRRRRRGRQQSDWTPLGMLDSFFRIDREQMSFKAAEYDSKMGVRQSRTRRRKEDWSGPPQQEKPQRAGFAYRYDARIHDDDSPTVVDIHATEEIEDDPGTEASNDKGQSAPESKVKMNNQGGKRAKKSDMSWEERQAAVERVPPANVPAWGPKGELPINARQKAIVDALKDIQTAKRKLNERVKGEIRARDEVAILNVDAKALRLKISQSRRRSRSTQLDMERLRKIELEIDDASRVLRRARKRVDTAKVELQELEDRHYAVLSYYNPDQASKLISDALSEFSSQIGSASYVSTQVDTSGSSNES
jgi:hypothetical protein